VIVVVNPQLKGAPEMPLTQRDEEVQTLSPGCAYEAFACGICLRRPDGSSKNPDAHIRHSLVQFPREDAVPVVDHEAVRMAARQGLTELLECPLACRMRRDVVMKDLSRPQFHDHLYIEDAESGGHYDEEITDHRCCGSGFRLGPPAVRYLCTVRGETRIPSFSFNSLAMRSSPQVGFSAAIFRISP
jgi:hypothetical protein